MNCKRCKKKIEPQVAKYGATVCMACCKQIMQQTDQEDVLRRKKLAREKRLANERRNHERWAMMCASFPRARTGTY